MYVYNIYIYLRYIYIDIFRPHEPLRLQPTVAPPCGGLPWGGHSLRPAQVAREDHCVSNLRTNVMDPPQSMEGAFS